MLGGGDEELLPPPSLMVSCGELLKHKESKAKADCRSYRSGVAVPVGPHGPRLLSLFSLFRMDDWRGILTFQCKKTFINKMLLGRLVLFAAELRDPRPCRAGGVCVMPMWWTSALNAILRGNDCVMRLWRLFSAYLPLNSSAKKAAIKVMLMSLLELNVHWLPGTWKLQTIDLLKYS